MLEVCFKPLFGCSLLQLLRLACVSYITVVMFKTILMSKKLRLGGGMKSHPKDKGLACLGFVCVCLCPGLYTELGRAVSLCRAGPRLNHL